MGTQTACGCHGDPVWAVCAAGCAEKSELMVVRSESNPGVDWRVVTVLEQEGLKSVTLLFYGF